MDAVDTIMMASVRTADLLEMFWLQDNTNNGGVFSSPVRNLEIKDCWHW